MKRSDFLDEDDWMFMEGFRIAALYTKDWYKCSPPAWLYNKSPYRKGIIAGLASAWGF